MFAKKRLYSMFSLIMVLFCVSTPISANAEDVCVPVTAEISAPKELHSVLITIEGQGNVALNRDKAYEGEQITLVAMPVDGWKFKQWITNGIEVGNLGFDGDNKNGMFVMPNETVEITVVFEKILTPPITTPTPVPPEDDIVIHPPKIEPDTFFDRIEDLVPAIITVTGSSFVAGTSVLLLLLFRRKKVFKGIFTELSIPGVKVKGNPDIENYSEWFIPYMIEKISDGQMTVAEYITTLNDAPVSTVFPSDTTMEVAYGKTVGVFKAQQKEMFKILSETKGEITFRFVSERTGMDFSITYDII